VLGVEIECRLGNAVSPKHYARGWHITATCGVFGAAAACARLLGLDVTKTAHALGTGDIASVTVTGHPLLLARADRAVNSARDAKISIHHSVAVVFLFGAAGLHEYSESAAVDPAVVALRECVKAQADPAVAVGAARVEARTTQGEVLSTEVTHARGSLALPMTDAEIEEKARALASIGCPACDVEAIIGTVWRLDQMDDLHPLMRLLAPA
jgi:2-methylcitrate dehydratase PrpD